MTPEKLFLAFTTAMNILTQRIDVNLPGNYFLSRLIPVYSRQIKACTVGPVYSSPSLGTFRRDFDPKVCFSSPCIPESPDEMEVKFILTTRRGGDFFIQSGDKWARRLITSKLVVVGVHGWTEDYKTDPALNATRRGWLNRGSDYITVDWSGGNIDYESAASNTRIVGALIGQLIDFLGIHSKTECLGFSYGAQACGFAGQWLKERKGKTLAFCTGIDVAGQNFEGCPPRKRLDRTDCGVVRVIHNSYINRGESQSFGITEKSGKCDFYFNFLRNEPTCPSLPLGDIASFFHSLHTDEIVLFVEQLIACNHLAGRTIYNEQLFSTPANRIRTKICSGPTKKCLFNSNSTLTGPNIVSSPPFDDCLRRNPFNSCGCLYK